MSDTPSQRARELLRGAYDKPGEKVAILEFKPKDRDAHGGGLGTGAPWLQTGGGEFLDEVEPGADDVDPTEAGALRKGFIRPEERPDEAAPPATPTNEED